MRSFYTEPYLEGQCSYNETTGIYLFNGDYTYGIGGTCLQAKVDYAKKWWYKHDTGLGVLASRRPLYPEPTILPLPLPKHIEPQIPENVTLPTNLLVGVGAMLVIGFMILMKFKI